MRQPAVTALVLAASLILAGCGVGQWAYGVGGRVNPNSIGLADRCGIVLKSAIPYADIEIGQTSSQNKGVNVILAHVEGARVDHPDQQGLPRNVAADCEFNDTVLVSFRLSGLTPGR